MFALIELPSACEIPTTGIVIVGSEPPGGWMPAALFAISSAVAPAACAASAFSTNVQVPRSISAMLPAIAAPLTIASQPSLTSGAVPSSTSTTLPVMPPAVIGGPNAAWPT